MYCVCTASVRIKVQSSIHFIAPGSQDLIHSFVTFATFDVVQPKLVCVRATLKMSNFARSYVQSAVYRSVHHVQ